MSHDRRIARFHAHGPRVRIAPNLERGLVVTTAHRWRITSDRIGICPARPYLQLRGSRWRAPADRHNPALVQIHQVEPRHNVSTPPQTNPFGLA